MTVSVALVLSVVAGGDVPCPCLSFTTCPAPGTAAPMAWWLSAQELREGPQAGPLGLAGPGEGVLDLGFMKEWV